MVSINRYNSHKSILRSSIILENTRCPEAKNLRTAALTDTGMRMSNQEQGKSVAAMKGNQNRGIALPPFSFSA